VNEPTTPIVIGVPVAVLPVLAAEAELLELADDAAEVAGDEDADEEEEELHPASSARAAARATAGKPARAPLRRDRVIAALPFLAGPAGERREAGPIVVSGGDVTVRNGT